MGLHFVFAGAAQDEPGVFVTLQENRTQLARVIGRFGWTIDDPNVTIMDRSPVDLYVDELVYELLDRIHEVGARRLVIDSLNDLIVAAPDPMRLREFLYSLVQRCARLGVSLMFTYETMELFRITRLSELGMSHIADNVVLLQHVQDGSADEARPHRAQVQRIDELGGHQRVQHLHRRHHARSATRPSPVLGLSLIDLEVGGVAAEVVEVPVERDGSGRLSRVVFHDAGEHGGVGEVDLVFGVGVEWRTSGPAGERVDGGGDELVGCGTDPDRDVGADECLLVE